ncbi:unnamed protein product [Vicia faba]|uniref:Uncharacterized protein n=1 Tax=Vicia faba TaxID=3906 RepID=A0AAV1B5B1_VICFA|nr:unnamed protein product [Vicia faba]
MEKVDCKLMMNVCCGIERNKGGVNHGLVIVDGNSEATGRRQWSCYGEDGWEQWNGFVMKGEQRQRELDRIRGSGVACDRGDDDGYRDREGRCYRAWSMGSWREGVLVLVTEIGTESRFVGVVVKEKEGDVNDGGVIKGSGRRCLGEGVCGFGDGFGVE